MNSGDQARFDTVAEARYRATLASIGDGVISTDAQGRVDFMNPVAERLTGWNEAEAKGRPTAEVFRIVNEESRAVVESPVARVIREGVVVGLANHTLLIAKDGIERPIADSGAPIRDGDGEICGVVLVFRDQTAERREERALRESEERFRAFFDNAPIGKSLTAPDGRLLRVNPAFGAMLGYSLEEMQDVSFAAITHPDDVAGSRECVRALLAGERDTWRMEKRYVAKDGRLVWTSVATRLQRDAAGEPLYFLTHVQDITDRKQLEVKLRDERDRIRTILDLVGDPIFVKDNDHRITFANRAFFEVFGLDEDDVLGRTLVEAVPENERKQFLAVDRRVLDTGVPDLREENLTVKALTRTIITRKIRFVDESGSAFLVGSIHDITARKKAEEALAETEKEYRALFETMSEGIVYEDHDGRIISANPAAERLLGLSLDQMQGRTSLDPRWKAIHEDGSPFPGEDHSLNVAAKTGKPATGEVMGIYNPQSGAYVWLSINSTPEFRPGEQQPFRAYAVFRDITEPKRMEKELRRAFEELSHEKRLIDAVINSMPGIFYILDFTGRFVRWNSNFERVTGYGGEELAEMTALALFEGEDRQHIADAMQKVAEKGEATVEAEILNKAGRGTHYVFTGVRAQMGGAPHLIGMGIDITDRKRAEDQARLLNNELEQRVAERTKRIEESNKELEAFSYSVSHDLRAPLRAIDGFARILTDDHGPKLDDEAKRVCSIIRENAGKMGRLIDDLLTFSRLGRAAMQLSSIDMSGMARAIFHEVTTPEQRASIDFQLEALPLAVGDPPLMRQVWTNLLSNALKFSSKRERSVIKISGETKAGENIFVVNDNGAGFDMQYVSKLFGVFQRLHGSKEFEGTGVGLALVQRVIHRHGGRVWAEGEPDRGATFSFALPHKGT